MSDKYIFFHIALLHFCFYATRTFLFDVCPSLFVHPPNVVSEVLFGHIGATAKVTCKGSGALVLELMVHQTLPLCECLATLGALEEALSGTSTNTLF